LLHTEKEIDELRRLLGRLPVYLANAWRDLGNGTGYFGDGSAAENGIRSNTNVAFAIAALLKHADGCGLSDFDRHTLSRRLNDLVRYLVNSHVSREGQCADGNQWGLGWQTSWWATKLALAAEIAVDEIGEKEFEAVRDIIAQEADRHLERLIPTGLMEDTKAEETAWDAEAIAAAIVLNPESERVLIWRKRLVEFAINTFSRPSDRNNKQEIDGTVVSEALKSCNIHEDGSLENHGAAHFCYVASPLLSKAWCAYALESKGLTVPQALNFNVQHVWNFTEPTFLENRFAYIGGQDWARYTYGEYFIVPALLFLASIGCGHRTGSIFQRRVRLLRAEAEASDDGSFFGARFTKGHYDGQLAKYETDCFACMALALEMLDTCQYQLGPLEFDVPSKTHISPESLTCYSRQDSFFFSFSWRTVHQEVPNIVFVPHSDDSLADWHAGNLIGSIWLPRQRIKWIGVKAMETSPAGLYIEGQHALRSEKGQTIAEHKLSIRLTNDLLRVSSCYVARSSIKAVLATGIDWSIPNDVFNGNTRSYFFEEADGSDESYISSANGTRPWPARRDVLSRVKKKFRIDGNLQSFNASRWLNIDNKMGVISLNKDSFALRRFQYKASAWNSLNVEKIENPPHRWHFNVPPGTVLVKSDLAIHLGDHMMTRNLAQSLAT